MIDNYKVFCNVGTYPNYKHVIRLTDYTPFKCKPYFIPYHLRKQAVQQIQDMLSSGIIETSERHPLLCVRKKDGSIRLYLDARRLSCVMIGDNETPTNLRELLQRFEGFNYMTSLDFKSGFHQIIFHERSRPYTAFNFIGQLYQFCKVP